MIAIPAQHAHTQPAGALRRVLPWLPLVAIVAALALSALLGRGPVPVADAATTIDVTGLVNEVVYLDATGCSDPAAVAIGDLVPGDPWKRTSVDCALLFGSSNSALGADLQVFEDPGAPASPADAMKCQVASCNGGSYDHVLNDVAANSVAPSSATSAFGAQLESATGLAAGVWTTGRANPIGAADTACSTTGIGDGTCAFRFGASASATDGPGAYQAQVQFLALAR